MPSTESSYIAIMSTASRRTFSSEGILSSTTSPTTPTTSPSTTPRSIFSHIQSFLPHFEKLNCPRYLAKQLVTEGNKLMKERNYHKAIDSFKDALRIIDYGERLKENNPHSSTSPTAQSVSAAGKIFDVKEINEVIVPALFGLADCNFLLLEHEKTLFYSTQLLTIQPDHGRMREIHKAAKDILKTQRSSEQRTRSRSSSSRFSGP